MVGGRWSARTNLFGEQGLPTVGDNEKHIIDLIVFCIKME